MTASAVRKGSGPKGEFYTIKKEETKKGDDAKAAMGASANERKESTNRGDRDQRARARKSKGSRAEEMEGQRKKRRKKEGGITKTDSPRNCKTPWHI